MIGSPPPQSGLQEAESRLRLLAAVVIFNVVLSSSYQDALFLWYHKKPDIPPAMLVGSLLTALTTLGLNRLLRSRPAAGALRIILLALGFITLVAAIWNHHPTPNSTLGLFLFGEVATTLGVAATWTYFQAPLEAAQIRWLLPRLGTWAGLGGLLAGTIIPILLRNFQISPNLLVWPSAFFWLIASFLVRSDYAARAPAKRRNSQNQQQPSLAGLFGIPLVRWMTIGSAGIVWTGLLLQYESRVALQQTGWNSQTITLIMCVLLAVSNVGGIATQVLVTTPVLEHFGVSLGLAILPAALFVCTSGYLHATAYAHLVPQISVWIIMLGLLLDKMLRPNLHRPAESCLVAALSPSIRPSLLLVLGGILQPIVKAVGALILWVTASVIDSVYITLTAVVLTLICTVLSTRWGSLYARTLRETLEEGSVDALGGHEGHEDLIPLIDGPRLRVLLDAFDTGSPRSRELSLELLRPHRSNLVLKEMLERATSASRPESVRITALRWFAQEPNALLEKHLQQRWQEASISENERVALLEAAGPYAPSLLGEDITPWISQKDLGLRTTVLKILLRIGDDNKKALAERALGDLLSSLQADEVIAALRLIHDQHAEPFLPQVLDRLGDPDPQIRREILTCLAAFRNERAQKPLWDALAEPAMAHVAVRALSTQGVGIVPIILGQLRHPGTPTAVRLHLLRLLGLLPSQAGVELLVEHLGSSNRSAQMEALKSLNKILRADPNSAIDVDHLHDFLMLEMRWGLHMLRARDILRDRLRPGGLLWRELQAQVDAAQQRVALTLSLLAPNDAIMSIFKTLISRNSPHRDQARELLRALFKPGPISTGALKLFDESAPWSPEHFAPPLSVQSGQTPQSAVDWLKLTLDPWVLSALRHDPDCPPFTSTFPPIEDPIDVHKDLLRFLKDVPLFEALTNRQLVEIARLAEKVDYPPGQVVFQQGGPPDYLYLVRKGKLRVLINKQEVARLGAGECVGEMAVLAGMRRTADVETIESCQLLRFSERDFLGLVDAYPELGRALLKSLVHRIAIAGRNKDAKRTLMGLRHKDNQSGDPLAQSGAHAQRPAVSGNFLRVNPQTPKPGRYGAGLIRNSLAPSARRPTFSGEYRPTPSSSSDPPPSGRSPGKKS